MVRRAIRSERPDEQTGLLKSCELNPCRSVKCGAKQDDDHCAVKRIREGSHCRTCAHTATDFRLKATSGGSR